MRQQVSNFLISRISQWDVLRIFGFPGNVINGFMGILNRAKDKMDFIQIGKKVPSLIQNKN